MIYLVLLLGIAIGIMISSIINAVRAGKNIDTLKEDTAHVKNGWKEQIILNAERNDYLHEIANYLKVLDRVTIKEEEKGEP